MKNVIRVITKNQQAVLLILNAINHIKRPPSGEGPQEYILRKLLANEATFDLTPFIWLVPPSTISFRSEHGRHINFKIIDEGEIDVLLQGTGADWVVTFSHLEGVVPTHKYLAPLRQVVNTIEIEKVTVEKVTLDTLV